MVAKYSYKQNKNNYLTPPDLINYALQIIYVDYPGNPEIFDCDVCCSNTNIPAKIHFKYGEEDGLLKSWYDLNYCNPPFNDCVKWVKKAYCEQQYGKTSLLLLPVRTETTYWHKYILYNPLTTIYWLRKGFKFLDGDTHQEMGVFKNALAFVLFKGKDLEK